MLISRLNESNKGLCFLVCVCLLLIGVGTSSAQQETTQSLTVDIEDTFSIERPIQSSFHSWELVDYDVRKVSLQQKIPADTPGRYRFVFEPLEIGRSQLVFRKKLNTALSSETLQNHVVSLTIEEERSDTPEESPQPSEDTQESVSDTPVAEPPETESEELETSEAPPEAEGDLDLDWSKWNEAQDLIESGYHDEARDIIDQRIGRTAGRKRQRWLNLKAKSFMDEEQYGEAVETWELMVERFNDGPQAKWLMSIAEAHRQNEAMDQAELALMQIRHRHSNQQEWPDAMISLAEMAIDRDNPKQAKKILQEARSRLPDRRNPDVLLKLAEVFDRYPNTRNYYRAVKLYENAARRFDNSDTRANMSRERADYLRENFLNFGTQ